MPAVDCPNCGAVIREGDAYCSHCGQRRIDDADRRLPALLRASVAEVTDLDGRLWPSLWALIFRPGWLSREYRLGRRRRYLSPIGLFLLANVLFFLAPSVSDLNLNFYDQYTLQVYSDWMRAPVHAALEARGVDVEGILANGGNLTRTEGFRAYATDYDARIGDIAKSMVIAHVPLLALGTLLLTFWRRLLYADHVVAALHFLAFVMIYYTAMPYTVLPLLRALDALPFWDIPVWSIAMTLKFFYVPFMLSTAFGVRWFIALPATLGLVYALLFTHLGYRLLQLWIGLAIV